AYYDGSAWVDAEYTTASSSDGSYTYVDTMTFTAAEKTETYDLALFMSDYQFGGDMPNAVSSGEQMTATLTMNWGSDTEEPTETTTTVTETTAAETTTTTVTTTVAAAETTESTTETAAASKLISISSLDDLDAGTYQLTASLSCWMSAMGGCDFGTDLLKSAVLTVGTDGSKKVTLYFHEMVDVAMAYGTASAYVENSGEIGYHNGSAWCTAEYSTATGTSEEGTYTYVNSMTFPISAVSNTYDLALCIGGTQFGGESARMISDGSVLAATLSVDWTKAYTNVKVSSNGTVTNAGGSTASPQTGDNVPLAAGIAMLVSAGTAVLLYKKKSER
ncbi:MAG: LPXTG cell wall anchor domain-containing protein, partial [Oscillospiraceae bacterium]|nr:LPXTG cell wall anchor domain-containing protein [Oscillospiraceae bacterium]